MKIKQLSILACFVSFTFSLSAQKFAEPSYTFSHKKPSYVTMQDGTTFEGEIDKLKRKKGLISEVTITDTKGKKQKLKPALIKHMYLMPSGFDKMNAAMDYAYDATKWNSTDLDKDIIGKGYVYFEQAAVKTGKKKRTLLMQLLNPSYSGKIKVYLDPNASETASVGVAGIKVAGGDAKSYYVSKGGAIAELLKKKNYDDMVPTLYGDCPAFVKTIGTSPKWTDLEKHIFDYGQTCK